MSLRDTQSAFARLVPRLIDKAFELGFQVTLGDAFRDERVFGPVGTRKGYGHPASAHKQRLAIDLNLFKDGIYLGGSEHHRELGEWWKQQHELAAWGGDFGDGNHYSFKVGGVR